MSKKGIVIEGSKFEKFLLLVEIIIVIVIILSMILSVPLKISDQMLKNILIFGNITVVLIGLVITGVSSDKEDELEEIEEKTEQETEEKEEE